MNNLDVLLWIAFPYAAAASFIVGHILRYRYDQYGWTSRSSQLYESKLLKWGSPLFHYGMLAVIAGHVIGLLIPREWLEFIGINEHIYHLGATWLGTAAAAVTVVGMLILLARRGAVKRVLKVTSAMDVVMYIFLVATIAFGTIAVVQFQLLGAGYDYRGSVSPWIRSLFLMQPDVTLMAGVPLAFQLHVLTATALFAIWPFTRLVHVLSAPIWYLLRPYVVYRSRDTKLGARKPRPGWNRSTLPVKEKEHSMK
ncbi:MAG: respiratory nitrate reductase subunit gamma [Homoserinimonas sp.]|nr:respiratory nitrate reductase subunit gamma [Homoserinimonas sp.]MCW5944482.1 respiratory nitrate reductase subunit gamma [Cryobacterium sp.]